MKHFLHTLLLILFLHAPAGEVGAQDRQFICHPTEEKGAQDKQFICHPTAEKGEEVWFHSILSVGKLPEKASLSISTTGFVLVYVNSRIAYTASLWPYRHDNMQGIATKEIDITGLLHYGRNVISVWYAPCCSPFYGLPDHDWQISPCITMVTDGKEQRYCYSKTDWLCSIAPGKITEIGEDYNAPAYQQDWKEFIYGLTPTWIGAENSSAIVPILNNIPDISLHACKTHEPISTYESKDTVRCYFPQKQRGQLRLTLRGAKKGQIISVNGMRYHCLGTLDEQFFTRFATVETDVIEITRITGNRIPDIVSTEIIELKTDRDYQKSALPPSEKQ